MASNTPSNEMKDLIRAIEDKKEARIQMEIRNTILRNDVAAYKEMAENEVKRNTHLKRILEQLRKNNEQERQQLETISSVQGTLKNGVMQNMTSFAASYVQQFQETVAEKKEKMEKKLQEEIDLHIASNPLFIEYNAKQAKLAELQRKKQKLVEEKKVLAQNMDVSHALFQQNIVEFAHHYQRQFALIDKLRNPEKKAEKRTSLMWQYRLSKPSVPLSSPPLPSQPLPLNCTQNDEMMPEPSLTSNSQEAIHVDEVAEGQSFNRDSILRGEKNQRSEVVNNESPKKATTSKRQYANKKNQNARNGKEKQSGALEPSQHLMRSGSSLKAATEVTSQKNQQPKIVQQSGSLLKPAPDASSHIKQQSKHVTACGSVMSYKSVAEVSVVGKKQQTKNVMPSGSCLKAGTEVTSKKNQQQKMVLPSGSSFKGAAEASSQKGQPSKKGKVTFVDDESSVSGVGYSKDKGNMSSEYELSAENDMDIESDGNVQMDDDENNDEPNDENINKHNADNDSFQEFDDFGQISNWTSLNVTTENQNSPTQFDFNSAFESAGSLFEGNDHKPIEAADNFNIAEMDETMGDMDNFF